MGDFSDIKDIKDAKALLADEFLHQISLNTAMQQSSQRVDALITRIKQLEASNETED